MSERANTRRHCDDPLSDSRQISENLVCELLLLTPTQLENYWHSEVISAPEVTHDRTLYLRVEIMKLKHTLEAYRFQEINPGSRVLLRTFPKVKMRLRKADCAIPSTWWYQARAIAERSAVENKHAESPYRFRAYHPDAAHALEAPRRRRQVPLA